MKTQFIFLVLALLVGSQSYAQEIPTFSPDDIDIPYQKYTLPNGLRLIVHEDHKAPIAAINVWYHVGSKNEKPGKSGFAHLFEHLMFNGSEHFNDDYFQALERIGATDLNGTTNNDRTNYFQNVPLAGLEQVLFLESDRMGHLLGAIDQAKLDEQRGVVQNEKRQGENQPYGQQWDMLTKAMFPKGHPYSWTVIGEMEDLNAASLEDVKEWFREYYGAANAVLVIAGDVDADDIYNKVLQYFGDIPSGPTLARQEVNIPVRTADTRQRMQDRVPEARIVQVWNTPEWGSREAAQLELAAAVLGSGKNSRLYKELRYDNQLASSTGAFTWDKEIAGNFIIQANVQPGKDVSEVENRLNSILETFRKEGPESKELKRVKAQYFSGYIKGLERIGGFGGKSDILAQNEVYGGNPDFYKTYLTYISEATPEEVRMAAEKWLGRGKHTLLIEPFPEYTTTESTLDRKAGLPELGAAQQASFPDMQKATLSNGMKIVLARREGIPTVDMRMLFDAGYASDQFAKPGTAALAMNMMDEGTQRMNALEINEQLQLLGASLGAYSDLDASYVTMNTLLPTIDQSLDLYADVVLNPAFAEKDFNRLKEQQLTQIQREKVAPFSMALRVMPKFLYGEDHPYGIPFTGSGYENTVQELSKGDVEKFYDSWIHPNNATLVVVGDISMDELKQKLETRFGKWKKGNTPKKKMATAEVKKGNTLYLMDRPESQQSVIISGYLTQPYGDIDELAKEAMVDILGGDFTSRLNLNLREDKHWSYGAGTFVFGAKEQRPFLAYAPVQTDKSSESVEEIIKEFKQFAGDKPATEAEFEKVQNNRIMGLPGKWETNSAVAGSMVEIIKYGLADNYYQTYDKAVRDLNLDDVHKVAEQMVLPDKMTWFVVGDKQKILSKLEELGFDTIIIVDSDGNKVEAKPSKP